MVVLGQNLLWEVDLLKSFFDPVCGNGNNQVGNYFYFYGSIRVKSVRFKLAAYYVTRSHALHATTLQSSSLFSVHLTQAMHPVLEKKQL